MSHCLGRALVPHCLGRALAPPVDRWNAGFRVSPISGTSPDSKQDPLFLLLVSYILLVGGFIAGEALVAGEAPTLGDGEAAALVSAIAGGFITVVPP